MLTAPAHATPISAGPYGERLRSSRASWQESLR